MFHWICPECGREIPPSVKECPACDPTAAPVIEVIAPPAEAIQSTPVIPATVDVPLQAATPEPEPEPVDAILAMAEQIRAAQLEAPVEPAEQPVAPRRLAPAIPLAIEGRCQPVALLAAPAVAVPIAVAETAAPAPVEQRPAEPCPPLAALQDYVAPARRAMRPAAPRPKILSPDTGPRITLPGPTLPPQLASLEKAALTVLRDPGRSPLAHGIPGWLLSFVVMLALLVAGGMAVFYLLPLPQSNAEAKTPDPVAAAAPAPAPAPTPAVSARRLPQSIEVTGFRFVVDAAKQSVLHYLLVNHSASGLSGITVFVTLRTAGAKPGEPPLCRFSFRAPGLGPFESREMISPIEKLTRTAALPDWQDLRAEVAIAE